jgi:ribosomal protein S19
MNRSAWKIPRVVSLEDGSKTYLRSATIGPDSIDKRFYLHNGHKFIAIKIGEKTIGYKLGQFVLTKKRVFHKKRKK